MKCHECNIELENANWYVENNSKKYWHCQECIFIGLLLRQKKRKEENDRNTRDNNKPTTQDKE